MRVDHPCAPFQASYQAYILEMIIHNHSGVLGSFMDK